MRKLWAVLLLVVLPSVARALDRSDVLLYLPFENTAEATHAGGAARPLVHGDLTFGPGKIGQGYLAGGPGMELCYPTPGNIDPLAGSVAMWIKPLGWIQKDPFMRSWMRVGETAAAGGKGDGTFVWLYKYLGSVPLYWLVQQEYRQRATNCVGAQDAYRDGEWTHVCATWCGPIMRLYVNGKLQGLAETLTPKLMRNFGDHIYFGGESWDTAGNKPAKPDTVLDEVFVFNRPLLEREVQELMQGTPVAQWPNDAGHVPPVDFDVQSRYSPSTDVVTTRLLLNGRRPDRVDLDVEIEPVSKHGDLAIRERVRGAVTEARSEASGLPKGGSYWIRVSDGHKPLSYTGKFEKGPRPEWLGNKLGVSDKPPAPFTPVTRKGNTLSCWGRTVQLGTSGLPEQITSQGRPLLARPIRLVCEADGPQTTGPAPEFAWAKSNVDGYPLPIPSDRDFFAEVNPSGVRLALRGRMDYDGLLWTEIIVPQQKGRTLQRLALEIPLRADVATLQHGKIEPSGQHEGPRDGKVEAWQHPLVGQPFLWLGNEHVGLQWSTADQFDWVNTRPEQTVELIPGGTECLLRITLVDAPLALESTRRPSSGWRFRFGLQATPVKPLPEDWRQMDLAINRTVLRAVPGAVPAGSPMTSLWFQKWSVQNEATRKANWLPGYPAPGPWAKEDVGKLTAEGLRPLLYWTPSWAWPGAPEYAAFHSDWNPQSPPPEPYETAGSTYTGVWRTVPSFRDWALWRINQTLSENSWLAQASAGFYLDVVQGFWGASPRVDDEGMVRTEHELLGSRELQQRLFVLLQQKWPQLRIVNHQSGDTIMSQLAFAHAYITGENYMGHPVLSREGSYVHVLALDGCRAELTGAKWGVPIIFLPENAPSNPPQERHYGPEGLPAAEHLAGLLFAHDVIPWPANTNPLPWIRLCALKQQFGWDKQTRFTGYWDSGKVVPVEADRQPVVVSVYRRPGKALFVIVNNSDQPAQVKLRPQWSALGVPAPKQLTDAITLTGIADSPLDMAVTMNTGRVQFKEIKPPLSLIRVPLDSGVAALTVPARNFRVLTTE